jgi:hypothetical protein
VTSDQAPRQNRKGHPCPPWCVTDHDEELVPGHFTEGHGGEGEALNVSGHNWVTARACHVMSRQPEVQVTLSGVGSVFVAPPAAEDLAGLVDALADAAPADVRQLAAAIRQAAAQITAPPPEDSAKCSDHWPVLDSEVGWYCAACGSDAPPAGQGGQA